MSAVDQRPAGTVGPSISPPVTPEEQAAFIWMQGRMIELLLRHDVRRFGLLFAERQAELEKLGDERLQEYRDLAVIFYLRDELFDNILVRIKRRLSFEAPRETQLEEWPARGRIDWSRTMNDSMSNWPGQAPLEVTTRKRRRHFATSENLLTVVTIMEYRAQVLERLENETNRNTNLAARHPLNEIIDQCSRELAFPQFAGLVGQCEEIVSGYHASFTTEELEQAVTDNLLPGHNSAYSDLLDWRYRLWNLRLLDRPQIEEIKPMLGSDPVRDNYLYQVWLFYEIGEMLDRQGLLINWDYAQMALTYNWGEGDEKREYRLQHDQAIKNIPAYWHNAPGVRPDFYIERVDRQVVKEGPNLIWHEPGFVLDAKYYKPIGTVKAPASPIKRMIADLQLTGERNGALLFAFHGNQPFTAITPGDELEEPAETYSSIDPKEPRQIHPFEARAQYIQPDIRINLWRICPEISAASEISLSLILSSVLEKANQALGHRIEIRCRGIFLDSLSASAHGNLAEIEQLTGRNGQNLNGPLEDLLICPKPHVAPWRVDLVNLNKDCCNNSLLCHIKGLEGLEGFSKPSRLTKLDQIKDAIREASYKGQGNEGAVADAATKQVLNITQRYADLIQPNFQDFQDQLKQLLDVEELFQNSELLNDTYRHTLALGFFLATQIKSIKSNNFAGPALLFTGTLEEMVRASIYKYNGPILDRNEKPLDQTLGTLSHSYQYMSYGWLHLIETIVNQSKWKRQITSSQTLKFEDWVSNLEVIAKIRNTAAHSANIDSGTYQNLIGRLFGSPSKGIGVLNGLILAWYV